MAAWQLPTGIHAADVNGDLVFLDARRDEYSCLPRSRAKPVIAALRGDPFDQADELLADLEMAGLIEPADSRGTAGQIELAGTARACFHDVGSPNLAVSSTTISRLLGAAMETGFAYLMRRPVKWFARSLTGESAPVTRACSLAIQFDRLRPLIPGSGRCLPKSMLLLAFLRRHGVHAKWTFGVQTFPFEAHCWVEYQGIVLSDTLEHVRWYTPIASF